MFIKRIFSRPKPKEKEVEVESLSLGSLRERIFNLRKDKIENFMKQLKPLADEINKMNKLLLEKLKELADSEPAEEVHPNLLKSATEARKLLVDKITRAISDFGRYTDFSFESISAFNDRLSKIVNLTTDTIRSHGRYVRAVYGQKSASVESCIIELHKLAMQTKTSIDTLMGDIKALDSVISEIDQITQVMREKEKTQDDIKLHEAKLASIEGQLRDETDNLTKLRASDEFRLSEDSAKKLDQIQHDIEKAKGLAASRISEMSRPFRKLEKLVESGVHPIESEKIRILRLCINDPVEIIKSDENIAKLEALLRETSELIKTGKIDLDEREKAKKLSMAQELTSELRRIKKTLEDLTGQLEIQEGLARDDIISRVAEVERLIQKHESDLNLARTTIEELDKKIKLMGEEIVTRRGTLEKSATDVLGVKVQITS